MSDDADFDMPTAADLLDPTFLDGATEVWERQTGETSLAYAAFCIYRDLGITRNLNKAAAASMSSEHPFSAATARAWSAKFSWEHRSRQYDDHLARKAREQREAALMEMNKRHATLAMNMQKLGMETLKLRMQHPETVNMEDMMALLTQGAAMERKARGSVEEKDAGETKGGLQIIVSYGDPTIQIGDQQPRADYRPGMTPVLDGQGRIVKDPLLLAEVEFAELEGDDADDDDDEEEEYEDTDEV